jgi:hypothetical protein
MLLIALAAAVVFLFSFHAKTGVYGSGTSVKVTSSTSAKLWHNGQKAKVTPTAQVGTLFTWFAILFIHFLYLHRKFNIQTLFRAPAPLCPKLLDWRHCLRPPPVE